jgi:hypothetical protein
MFDQVLHLHLADGQTIRTTPEHPFWVRGEGWLPADLLRAGDALATLGGEWIEVAEAFDTGEYETVYNCRVAEWHTYFVGDDAYVTAVWAHNAYWTYVAIDDWNTSGDTYTLYSREDGTKLKATVATGTTGAPAIGDSVTKPSHAAALQFVQTHAASFGLQVSTNGSIIKLIRTDPAKRQVWTDVVGEPDARGVARKTAAESEFTTFQTDNPNFFTTHHQDPAFPNDPTKQKTGKELTNNDSFSDVDLKIHAHHIVMKVGDGPGVVSVRKAHQLLRTVGIDPYYSEENLVWAPNWRNHQKKPAYPDQVWKDLEDLGIARNPSPTPASVAAMASERAEVEKELKRIAGLFFTAEYVM